MVVSIRRYGRVGRRFRRRKIRDKKKKSKGGADLGFWGCLLLDFVEFLLFYVLSFNNEIVVVVVAK